MYANRGYVSRYHDFKIIREKKCAFEGVEGEIEIIGI
jgi:hypothetical protein